MSDRDDERRLRAAFARLREEEAQRAPTLAQLRARAAQGAERAPWSAWLRLALPLAGGAAVAFVWWISARTPSSRDAELAAAQAQPAQSAALPETAPLIAIGSLRSPTDALLAPPIAALPTGFSSSLIPTPRVAPTPQGDQQTRATPTRRFPA